MTKNELVKMHLETLKRLDRAGLTAWGKANGCDSRAGFAAYKKALKANGIDYDAEKRQAAAAAQEGADIEIEMYSDAKAKNDRFGITDADGAPLWHGRFFDNDRDYDGEQSTGEMAAAKKAVWLASKIGELIGKKVKLILNVDAQWLCYANEVFSDPTGKSGGKARKLGEQAIRCGVALEVRHVAGVDNPADEYTVCTGYLKWQDGIADLLKVAQAA